MTDDTNVLEVFIIVFGAGMTLILIGTILLAICGMLLHVFHRIKERHDR